MTKHGDIKLVKGANAIGVKPSAALASSYDITLPPALPTSTLAVQRDVNGVESYFTPIAASTVTTIAASQNGQPLYVDNSGQYVLGIATGLLSSKIVGLASNVSGLNVSVVSGTSLTLADWTNVVGSTLLVSGAIYYLSDTTAGRLTTVAPTTTGNYVAEIGKATSTTTLLISIQPIILL